MSRPTLFSTLGAAALFFASTLHATIVTIIWDGGGADGLLTTSVNWDGDNLPLGDGTEAIYFGSSSRYNVIVPNDPEKPVDIAVLNLIFPEGTRGGNYVFSGASGATLLINGFVQAQGLGDITFDSSLDIIIGTSSRSIEVGEGISLTVNSDVSGTDTSTSLIKTGAGTLVVSGANTFQNGLTISAGTLTLGSSSNGSSITTGPVGTGTLTLESETVLRVSVPDVTLHNHIHTEFHEEGESDVDIDIGDAQTLTLAGQIEGNSTLIKKGNGTLSLANGGNNFDGGVIVEAGTLQIAAQSNLEMQTGPLGWGGALEMHNGTTLQRLESAGDVTIYNDIVLPETGETNVNIDTGGFSTLALLGTITGSASLTKSNTGYLLLAKRDGGGFGETSDNSFSGGLKILSGTLLLGSSSHYTAAEVSQLLGPAGSGTLLLKDGTALRVASGAGSLVLHNDIELDTAALSSVVIGTEQNNLALHGDITGAAKLTKEGGYTLTLYGDNSFSGGMAVNGGHLEVSSSTGTGTGALHLSTSEAVSVDFNESSHTIGGLNGGISGSTIGLDGEGGTSLVIDQTAQGAFGGGFEGGSSSSITKTGAATLTLAGNNGTFYGNWAINGGTLAISADVQLGAIPEGVSADAISLNGGTLQTTGNVTVHTNRGITLGSNGGTFSPDASTSLTYGGVIAGSGITAGLTKTGTGTLVLSGQNTYEGPTKITAGTLTVSHLAHGGAASPLGQSGNSYENLWLNGGTLRYEGTGDTTDRLFSIGNTATLDASGSGAATFSNTGALGLLGSGARTFNLRGTSTGNNIFAPVITDKDGANPTNLAKHDAGKWIIASAQSYTGSTTVHGGTLSLAVNNALSASTAVTVNSGAVLDLGDRNLAIAGLNGLGSVTMSAPEAGNSYLEIGGTNASSAFSGILSGSGSNGLVKNGTGMLTLSGANTFGGGTGVNAGTLRIANGSALGSGAVTVAANATLDLHHTLTVSSQPLTVSGTGVGGSGAFVSSEGHGTWLGSVSLGGSNVNLGGAGTLEIGGIVSGSASLTKVGTGNLILGGANDYSGGTVIKQGVVNANHASALGSGSVTFEGGALSVGSGVTLNNALNFSSGTTVLAGNGTFGTHITANEHVVLSPGNSPGTLTFNAGLTLATGSAISFQVQHAATTAGAGWDLLSVSNDLNLTAISDTITFNIVFLDSAGNSGVPVGFNSATEYSWTFATSTTPITGFSADQFHLVTEGPSAPFGFTISKSTDGLSLLVNYSPSFAPVPEPSTYALLALGLGFVGLTLYRRRP